MNYTNRYVQHEAQICAFNIKSINQRAGYYPEPLETFEAVERFVYHYENYCFRVFVLREKLLQFINAVLPVGYKESQVKIQHIVINPIIRQAKLLSLIEKFNKPKGVLRGLIDDRHALTHKLYYGKNFDNYLRPNKEIKPDQFKDWCNDWKNEIMNRARQINTAERLISKINNGLAKKILDYKDFLSRVSKKLKNFKASRTLKK